MAQPGSSNGTQSPQQLRQSELKAELNEIKSTQSSKKSSKTDLINRHKALQESMKSNIAALNASKGKLQYSSVEAIDAQIAKVEAQVESGTLKLVDERKAVDEA